MDIASLLTNLLVTGAGLATSNAVSEFAKGTGKAAFEAVKERLTSQHGVKSMTLLDRASSNLSFRQAIESELNDEEIESDVELLRLAEALSSAIVRLPAETQSNYAIDTGEISSTGSLIAEHIEGLKANRIVANDIILRNIKAPPPGK